MMPTGRNTWRTWVFVGLAAFVLFVIWIPNTSIPSKSKEALGKAWQHVTGSKDPSKDEGVVQMGWATPNETGFNFDKWFFQFDLEYENPSFDTERLKTLAPHNYKGPGHPVFATFFATRSPSLQDPYFMATQQVVYRNLWDPRSASLQYPMIVFVAPFVTQAQRDLFAAAGALVRELDLVPFHPKPDENGGGGVAGRLMDMFSKLEMWKQTDFSRIAYMDSDAFPLENIDRIFELAPELRCKPGLLPEIDIPHGAEMCDYVFAGHAERPDMVNAGVIVIKPNMVMHDMLIRESHNMSNYEQGLAEQAFVNYIYRPDGPFPPTHLPAAWNGFPDFKQQGEDLYIVHAKLWVPFVGPEHWAYSEFEYTWDDMKRLYDSEAFIRIREEDDRSFNELR